MPKTKAYNVRVATEKDIIDLTILGKQFVKESQYYDLLGWDASKVHITLTNAMEREDFEIFCFCCDSEVVGLLACFVTPCFFSETIQAVEMLWYVDPEHRGSKEAQQLLDHYEEWAKEKKAVVVNLINLDVLNAEKVGRLYERRGYRQIENTFIKEL